MTTISQAHQKFRTKMQMDIITFLSDRDALNIEGHDVIAVLYQVIEDLSRNIDGFRDDEHIRMDVITEIKNYNRQLVQHLEQYPPSRSPSPDLGMESSSER
jgi:hypothetical protein